MIILTQVGFYKNTIEDEHLCGIVELLNEPPKNLEYPDITNVKLHLDTFLIDSDEIDFLAWIGCRAHWNKADWHISTIHPINVKQFTGYLVSIMRFPLFKVTMLDRHRQMEVIEIVPADCLKHAGAVAKRWYNNYKGQHKILAIEELP